MSQSEDFRRAAYAQETERVFTMLVEIDHPSLAEPIRVCDDGADVTSRGNLYIAYPFEIVLPFDKPDEPPRASIRIDNVAELLIDTIRSVQGKPSVRLEMVLDADPEIVEHGPLDMNLTSASYTRLTIEGDLAYEDVFNEPAIGDAFTPALFPGLFP